ncbi:hypothetical protein ABK040_005392 [Willaertia magna]
MTKEIDIHSIIDIIQFPKETLFNLYQTGSRVYKTNTIDSDYDFFCIITDDFYNKLEKNYEIHTLLNKLSFQPKEIIEILNLPPINSNDNNTLNTEIFHTSFENQWLFNRTSKVSSYLKIDENLKNDDFLCNKFTEGYQCLYLENEMININLYKYSTFQKKLNENWLQALMCIYLPKEHIWKEDLKFNFKLYFRKLIISVVGEAGKHFQMARRKWKNNEIVKNKKYIIHTFRDLLFGIQIVKNLKIIDYTIANNIYYEIMNCKEVDWKYYEKVYYKKYQELKDEFNEISLNKEDNDLLKCFNERFKSNNGLNEYLEYLRLYYSIEHVVNEEEERFVKYIYLKPTIGESPIISKIVRDVYYGMVLKYELNNYNNNNQEEKEETLTIVTSAMPCIIPYSNQQQSYKIKNWDKIIYFELIENTKFIQLYFENNKWSICSNESYLDNDKILIENKELELNKLFWTLFEQYNYKLPNEDIELNFVFIINVNTLNLIYVKNRKTKETINDLDNFTMKYNFHKIIPSTKYSSLFYPYEDLKFQNIAELKSYTNTLDPMKVKELIVIENNSNFVSIPSLQNLAYHYFKNKFNNYWDNDNNNIYNEEDEINMLEFIRSIITFIEDENYELKLLNKVIKKYIYLYNEIKRKLFKLLIILNEIYNYLLQKTNGNEKEFNIELLNMNLSIYFTEDINKHINSLANFLNLQLKQSLNNVPKVLDKENNFQINNFKERLCLFQAKNIYSLLKCMKNIN